MCAFKTLHYHTVEKYILDLLNTSGSLYISGGPPPLYCMAFLNVC